MASKKRSIHLFFTEYEFALKVGNRTDIYPGPPNQAFRDFSLCVEDRSRWVADLDILEALDAMRYNMGGSRASCIPRYEISDRTEARL